VWLSTIPYVGPVLQKRMLHMFGTPQDIYKAGQVDLKNVQGLNRRALRSLLDNRSLKRAEGILTETKKHAIRLLTFADPLYPAHGKECPESPVLLYYRGEIRDFQEA